MGSDGWSGNQSSIPACTCQQPLHLLFCSLFKEKTLGFLLCPLIFIIPSSPGPTQAENPHHHDSENSAPGQSKMEILHQQLGASGDCVRLRRGEGRQEDAPVQFIYWQNLWNIIHDGKTAAFAANCFCRGQYGE